MHPITASLRAKFSDAEFGDEIGRVSRVRFAGKLNIAMAEMRRPNLVLLRFFDGNCHVSKIRNETNGSERMANENARNKPAIGREKLSGRVILSKKTLIKKYDGGSIVLQNMCL